MDLVVMKERARPLRPESHQLDPHQAYNIIKIAVEYNAHRAEGFPPPAREVISTARWLVGYARLATQLGWSGRERQPGVSAAILEAFEAGLPDPWRDYSGARG